MAHYREYAAQIRGLAEGEPAGVLRDKLVDLAQQYERLAEDLEPES